MLVPAMHPTTPRTFIVQSTERKARVPKALSGEYTNAGQAQQAILVFQAGVRSKAKPVGRAAKLLKAQKQQAYKDSLNA